MARKKILIGMVVACCLAALRPVLADVSPGTREWALYVRNIDDHVALTVVNLKLRAHAPHPDRPHLLWVKVHFLHPRDNGLPPAEESKSRTAIENGLAATLRDHLKAVMAGHIVHTGSQEMYFYAPAGDGFEAAVKSVMKAYPQYRYEQGHRPDPTWSVYLQVLRPQN